MIPTTPKSPPIQMPPFTRTLRVGSARAEKIKQDFPIFKTTPRGRTKNGNTRDTQRKLVYLDNAATTQKPCVVLDTMQKYYTHYAANVHRGIYPLAEKATTEYEHAREVIARYIGAEPQETIFTSGTTESLNIIARALETRIKKGDEIVLSVMEHHSNLVVWQQLAKRRGARLRYLTLKEDQTVDEEYARKQITKKTRILALSAMSNVLGTSPLLTNLIERARKVGAYTVIDAAQAMAHAVLNVKEMKCDFLAFSGHKLFGPTGIGVLYGRRKLLESLTPVFFGGEMISSVTLQDSDWNELPWKWEAGTPKIAQAIGLGAAVKYLERIDVEKTERYLQKLTTYARTLLGGIPGLRILNHLQKRQAPIITFTMLGIHPHDIAEILGRDGICIRAGHHCAKPLHHILQTPSSARISLAGYNTVEDVQRLYAGLCKVQRVFANG